jgi:DNA-binding transcriptional LysR family regulator
MANRKIDLNLLPVLLALIDAGSVSAAARTLGMSQPAVSSALAKLRLCLDDPLFVRTARGMQATPRALALEAPIRAALGQVSEEVLQSAAFDATTSSKTFVLALSDIGEMVFLPQIVDHFSRHAPHGSLRSVTLAPDAVAQGLENGSIDLAVGYFPDLAGSNIYQQRLFGHTFVSLLRAGHPIKARKLSTRQFLSLGHAVVRAEGRSQEVFERFLERRGITRRVALSTPHFMSIPSIVARSDLIATVPLALGVTIARFKEIRLVHGPFAPPRFDLRQHWHRKYANDAASKWLRGVIAGMFTDERNEWSAHTASALLRA